MIVFVIEIPNGVVHIRPLPRAEIADKIAAKKARRRTGGLVEGGRELLQRPRHALQTGRGPPGGANLKGLVLGCIDARLFN